MENIQGAVVRERDDMMQKKKLAKSPTLRELKVEMTALNTCATIFPIIFKLLDILLTLPVGACSYSGTFFQPNEDGEDKTTFQAE